MVNYLARVRRFISLVCLEGVRSIDDYLLLLLHYVDRRPMELPSSGLSSSSNRFVVDAPALAKLNKIDAEEIIDITHGLVFIVRGYTTMQ